MSMARALSSSCRKSATVHVSVGIPYHPIGNAEEFGEGPDVSGQVARCRDDAKFMGQGGRHIQRDLGGANDRNLHQLTGGVQAVVEERRPDDCIVPHAGHFHHLPRHGHF
jgi:hypothetical protein